MNYDPRYVYLYPASIPQIVAHIQEYLRDNPITSTATITQMIITELSEHPEILNGAEIPITAEDQQSIKDYIDHLPSVDGYTKEQVNALLDEKQDVLTFDRAPTPNSSNPVTSSGISTAITTAIATLSALINLKANLSDVYTKSVIDQLLSGKANVTDVYTKTVVDTLLGNKANAADVYTKTETDTLMESKADETEVTDLKSAFDFFENSLNFTPIQVNINKSIDIHPANPTIKPSSIKTETGWCCVCVPCAEGDVFHVTGKGGYTTRLWGFADSNGALIDGYESESGAVGNYTVVIAPADAAYFAYNSNTDVTYGVCKGYNPNKTIQIVDEEHDAAEEKLSAENKQLNTALGLFGAVEFTVESGATHSSTKDKAYCDIKSGETFYVTVAKSESTAVSGSIFVHKSDESVNLGTIAIDGKRHAFTAPADITWVGLYLNPLAYTQTYNMRVEKEDNIYIDIDNAGSAVEDKIKRGNIFKNSSKNFIFFTDIHGSLNNMSKIVAYANKYHANIDFIINGGDTVSQYLDDGIAWYDTAVNGSDVDVLTAVGNHDVWDDALYDKLPATIVYSNFIAPVAANVSGIVQPEDAATDGKCYYYKDYGSVRVIVLNAMSGDDSVTYWDENAKTWLEAVLADAKTNSKHVLCVNHTPFTATDRVLNTDSQWTSFKPYFDGMVLEPEAVAAVQNYIDGGGIFIGWLVGHGHTDAVMANDDGQFMFAGATAHYADGYFHADGYGSNNTDDATYNCFNLCGIDTTNKIFKMVRIGWDMDSAMKKRSGFSYDYQNRKILCDRG